MQKKADYKLYEDAHEVKGYSVFVRPDGKIYRVNYFDDPEEYGDYLSHATWAKAFIEQNAEMKKECDAFCHKHNETPIIYLTAHLHYVVYARTLDVASNNIEHFSIFPIYSTSHKYYNYECTEEQIDTLREIVKVNQDTPDGPFMEYIEKWLDHPKLMQNLVRNIIVREKSKVKKLNETGI